MNDWQKRFTQKVETVRNASSERFEEVATRTLSTCFEEFHQFTAQHGLTASAPLAKPGIRTFKFAMTENAYVLLTFKLSGLEGMELLSEFVIPSRGKLPPINQAVELAEANDVWSRRAFEQALDHFVDAFVESMDGQDKRGKQVPASAPA
jgi:hypothetical protein